MKQALERVDHYQREHTWAGVAVAVGRKFGEDRSTALASMIAFWAFFSLFPLFMVLVTLLGFFLPADTKDQVLSDVGQMFPLLDTTAVSGLSGAWWALLVGLLSALWSGSAVVRTTQDAFNSVWEIPQKERPNLVEQTVRSLGVLATLGVGVVVSTLISGFVSGAAPGELGWFGRLVGYAIAIALDVGLFVAAFRWLTDRQVTTRQVLPGALLSGVVFWVLQSASSLIISRYLQNAESTYADFATVITLLWWLYLQGIVTLLGAQLNVVLEERLHPRALVDPPDTEADRRALRSYARERTYEDEERVDTRFQESAPDRASDTAPGPTRDTESRR